MVKIKKKIKLTAWQFLAIGYLTVIFVGSLLLSLPFATAEGKSTNYLNALFTSTSATCVTGLVPYDTGSHWSVFGQVVILCLIQTGGLGFMTFVTILFNLIGKNMGVYNQKILMLSAGEENRDSLKRLFRRLLIGTAIFELSGAAILSVRFIKDFGLGRGIYYAVWHSVSAFCNAGFDLLGGEFGAFCSLTRYLSDPLVSLTIAALILIGGLGFCVWDDVLECKFNPKKFRLHTKVALVLTALLVFLPTLFFFFLENTAFEGLSTGERWLAAIFAAVTPRTAGFNTVDLNALSDGSYLMTIILMFIGGNSASTAGGIKVTTFAVIVMGILSVFRGKQDIEMGNRRIRSALLRQAMAIFVSCLFLIMLSTLLICVIEEENAVATLQRVLFEVTSALGTVGLSMSLTPTLSAASKIILILLMYAGRVGILTIALAFGESGERAEVKKPVENILIG